MDALSRQRLCWVAESEREAFCRQLFAQFSASFILCARHGNNTLRTSLPTHNLQSVFLLLSLSRSTCRRISISLSTFSDFSFCFCSRITTLHNRTLDAYLNYYKLVFIFAENLNDFGLLHHCNKLTLYAHNANATFWMNETHICTQHHHNFTFILHLTP